jgi:hypothetical protein
VDLFSSDHTTMHQVPDVHPMAFSSDNTTTAAVGEVAVLLIPATCNSAPMGRAITVEKYKTMETSFYSLKIRRALVSLEALIWRNCHLGSCAYSSQNSAHNLERVNPTFGPKALTTKMRTTEAVAENVCRNDYSHVGNTWRFQRLLAHFGR